MFSHDSKQQQNTPSNVYPPRGPVQLMDQGNQGRPAPVTDKVPNVPNPSDLRSQPWPQPDRAQQPGMVGPQPGQTPPPGAPWTQPQPVVPARPRRSRTRSAAIFALTCLLAIVFGVGIFSGWTFAHTSGGTGNTPAATSTTSPTQGGSSLSALESAQEAAIAKVLPAVVQIQGATFQGESVGSGVIIDPQGDIVTNNHVVDGASSLTVTFSNGTSQTAQVVGTDPSQDLAVLRIRPFSGMVVATLGDSAQLAVGQEVLAIGSPLGYSGTVTSGVVSALNRTAQESRSVKLNGMIQTSAPINPGNSGGALINLQGQVVGIPTLSAVNSETGTPAEGIGFAIPSNTVQSVVTQILGNR